MTNPFTRELFGPMFSDPSLARVFGAEEFTKKMLAFEASWTKALAGVGAVDTKDAEEALAAIKEFDGLGFIDAGINDGLPVPAFVKALRAGLSKGGARAVHSGATSQDVLDTAMACTLVEVAEQFRDRLVGISAKLAALNERVGDRTLMGRTRMQAALPATASLRIEAWHRAIKGQIARADMARDEVSRVQIGGPIGVRDAPAGQGEAMAQRVAEDLKLTCGPVWHSDRSGPVSFGHWLTLVSGSLGKIGQDICLMAQQGIDEIRLCGGGGSSAMPHKQNPVVAEAMVTLARFVAAQQGGLAQAMIHEQERSGAAWALEWMTLPAMAEATGAALNHAAALLDQIETIGGSED